MRSIVEFWTSANQKLSDVNMQINRLNSAMRSYFNQWFHKRNIIIVSEHKVKHIPLAAKTQFGVLMLATSFICWASYSTGSFMAARSALQEQNQTLRDVASARIETNFSSLYPSASLTPTSSVVDISTDSLSAPLHDPMYTLAALDNNKLVARVAFLEHKIEELRSNNEEIIQRVRDKTSGRINDLESIIKQTGLNGEDLQKQLSDDLKAAEKKGDKLEGGPFIPSGRIDMSAREHELFESLDKLAVLHQIVTNLPLAVPVTENADEQSPFGHRIDPFTGHLAFHSGLDISGPTGTKIRSTAGGKVVSAGWSGAYGNAVDIDHGFGVTTRYGHLSRVMVEEGQQVSKGEIIGMQGSTGRSTGPHVHYEVRYHDKPMNPKKFIEAGKYVSEE